MFIAPFFKGEHELQASSGAVADTDGATEGLHSIFNDGESKPCATDTPGTAGINAVEALKKVREVLFAYAGAIVVESKGIVSVGFGNGFEYHFGAVRVKGGILDEVGDHSGEQGCVALDDAVKGDIVFEFEVSGEAGYGYVVGESVDEVVHVDIGDGDVAGAFLKACHGGNIVEECA